MYACVLRNVGGDHVLGLMTMKENKQVSRKEMREENSLSGLLNSEWSPNKTCDWEKSSR